MIQAESHACHRCFKDKVLVDLIRSKRRRGWCDWCGGRNVYVIPLYEIGDIFRDVASIYQHSILGGDQISFLLQEDWEVFSDTIELAPNDLRQRLKTAILQAGLDPKDYSSGDYPDYDGFFHRKDAWLVNQWQDKAEAYFADGQKNFNETVLSFRNHLDKVDDISGQLEAVFEELARSYKPGHILYRARIHKDRFRSHRFNLSEVGAPKPEEAKVGRANRKNEPVLYLANNDNTALAEVRAWKGMAVAIARFEVIKPLSVVSLLHFELPESPFFNDILEWKVQLAALFYRLAEEFSRPTLPNEEERIYFSTQYLCDWIKKFGYDGIEYPSAMGSGFNVVIFDQSDVKAVDIEYRCITAIEHSTDTLKENEPMYEEGPFDYLFMKQLDF
jgi:hypothetical protein